MALPVVVGASLMCPMGTSTSSLVVVPKGPPVHMEKKPAATIMDFTPLVNILPFGMCKSLLYPLTAAQTAAALGALTPAACIPATTPWTPGSTKVTIGGIPALTNTSKCQCVYGGSISIVNPSTTKETIP